MLVALQKKARVLIDQVLSEAVQFWHNVAARRRCWRSEVALQAEGVVKDARKWVQALAR